MISISADFNGVFMAREQYLRVSWGQLWSVVGVIVGAFGVLIGIIYSNIQDRLLSIDTSISAINISLKSNGEALARIDEKVKYLDRRVETLERPHWESKAKASGLKNTQIVPASSQSPTKFESKFEVGAKQFALHYTILKYDPVHEVITLRFDGEMPNSKIRDNIFMLSVKPGQSVQLPTIFENLPKIFMQIIDRPSPDRAIIAIGQKADSNGKRS